VCTNKQAQEWQETDTIITGEMDISMEERTMTWDAVPRHVPALELFFAAAASLTLLLERIDFS
jgi:hypothetical protein